MNSATFDSDELNAQFLQFQLENPGFDSIIVLSPEGKLEYVSDPAICSEQEAAQLFHAWKEHQSAVILGEDRFPILSWEELQFAARNVKGKGMLVGSRTKTNRYVVIKLGPTAKIAPTIAAIQVNRWAWNVV